MYDIEQYLNPADLEAAQNNIILVKKRKKRVKRQFSSNLHRFRLRNLCIGLLNEDIDHGSRGSIINKWFTKNYFKETNNASDNNGDNPFHGQNVEVKATCLSVEENTFGFKQLRPTSDADLYLLYAFDNFKDKEYLMVLNKNQMKDIIVKYSGNGSNYMHGTTKTLGPISENIDNKMISGGYSISCTRNSPCWRELSKYNMISENIQIEEVMNDREFWQKNACK